MLNNAALAVNRNDTSLAAQYCDILAKDPYFEDGILLAADFYNETVNDPFRAYKILFDALTVNRYSIALNKAFVLQCADMNMMNYGQDNLERLQERMTSSQYRDLQSEIKEKEAEIQEKFEQAGFR